ncbi:hypothetical protein EDD17DRAFT_1649731, partial [Pisolithus thermaeus]
MALFSSVAVVLQAVLAAIPDAVHLVLNGSTLRVNPCDYYFLCEPAAKLEFVEIFTPYDKASMERLCAGSYLTEHNRQVRGYLISRILLTFQVNEDKTTTCQMLLIWQYAWRPEFAVEDPSMSETDSNANTPNPI